jgi:hypothetical protein
VEGFDRLGDVANSGKQRDCVPGQSLARAMIMKCRAQSRNEPPLATVVAVANASAICLCQSTIFIRGLTNLSSDPKSAAIRAALLEQPASLSSSA